MMKSYYWLVVLLFVHRANYLHGSPTTSLRGNEANDETFNNVSTISDKVKRTIYEIPAINNLKQSLEVENKRPLLERLTQLNIGFPGKEDATSPQYSFAKAINDGPRFSGYIDSDLVNQCLNGGKCSKGISKQNEIYLQANGSEQIQHGVFQQRNDSNLNPPSVQALRSYPQSLDSILKNKNSLGKGSRASNFAYSPNKITEVHNPASSVAAFNIKPREYGPRLKENQGSNSFKNYETNLYNKPLKISMNVDGKNNRNDVDESTNVSANSPTQNDVSKSSHTGINDNLNATANELPKLGYSYTNNIGENTKELNYSQYSPVTIHLKPETYNYYYGNPQEKLISRSQRNPMSPPEEIVSSSQPLLDSIKNNSTQLVSELFDSQPNTTVNLDAQNGCAQNNDIKTCKEWNLINTLASSFPEDQLTLRNEEKRESIYGVNPRIQMKTEVVNSKYPESPMPDGKRCAVLPIDSDAGANVYVFIGGQWAVYMKDDQEALKERSANSYPTSPFLSNIAGKNYQVTQITGYPDNIVRVNSSTVDQSNVDSRGPIPFPTTPQEKLSPVVSTNFYENVGNVGKQCDTDSPINEYNPYPSSNQGIDSMYFQENFPNYDFAAPFVDRAAQHPQKSNLYTTYAYVPIGHQKPFYHETGHLPLKSDYDATYYVRTAVPVVPTYTYGGSNYRVDEQSLNSRPWQSSQFVWPQSSLLHRNHQSQSNKPEVDSNQHLSSSPAGFERVHSLMDQEFVNGQYVGKSSFFQVNPNEKQLYDNSQRSANVYSTDVHAPPSYGFAPTAKETPIYDKNANC